MFRSASPSDFLPKIEASFFSFARVLDTCCSSIAVGSFHTGGPFLFCRCAVSGGLKVSKDVQEVCHPHLHLHGCLEHDPYMLVFALTWQSIACFFGWPDRSLDFVAGCFVRLVRSNTICPIVEFSAGEENKPKAGHVILSPWGCSSKVAPEFLIGNENKIGTSPVSNILFFFSTGGPLYGLDCQTLSVVPCPETWSFIINVALLAGHFILRPLSKVVFSIFFYTEGSIHSADVSAHAEWRIFIGLFDQKTSKNVVFTASKVTASKV